MAREVERIKEKLDLVEFLRGYLDLQSAGKNLKATCPFHSEKTPSFIVSPDRQMWRCFGACGEGGDIFTFLMKHENLEFHEALKVLAERAGVPLAHLNPRQQKEFGVLYDINSTAQEFFIEQLKTHEGAKAYLKNRGVTGETARTFAIGFSPGGEALTLYLLGEGHDIGDIVRAGLAKKNDAGLYRDKFYQRVMFPIRSTMGKTVAFSGRILPSAQERMSMDVPKYVNSPETPIFNKSKILYGLDTAKNAIAEEKSVFLVEGQMDVVMACQSGVRNAVAVSGTALTPYHLEKLRRLADTVVVSFDNDEAGRKALERALALFGNFDFHVKVADLGKYGDPADAGRADPQFLGTAIAGAKPAFLHLFESSFALCNRSDIPARKRLIAHLLGLVKSLKSSVEQHEWIGELSRVSGVSENVLLAEFEGVKPFRASAHSEAEGRVADLRAQPEELLRTDRIMRRLCVMAFAEDDLLDQLKGQREFVPSRYHTVLDEQDSSVSEFRMQASHEFGSVDPGLVREEFNDLLRNLKSEVLKERQGALLTQIRESGGEAVMQEFYNVSRELESLKK
jgi:DNA primase